MSAADVETTLVRPATVWGLAGTIIWGDSSDCENATRCGDGPGSQSAFLNNTLGPALRRAADAADACASQRCSAHGRCWGEGAAAACDCDRGWSGWNCTRRTRHKTDDANASWQRGKHIQLIVDSSFTYSVTGDSGLELTRGLVGLRCGGQYLSSHNGGLRRVGAQNQRSGTDPRLGSFDEISQGFDTAEDFATAASCEVTAAIRYLHAFDAFTFKLTFPAGAKGTLAYPAPTPFSDNKSTGLPLPGEWAGDTAGGWGHGREAALPLASHFPSLRVPPELDFMATAGNMLTDNFVYDKMQTFRGGLGGGFLTIFNGTAADAKTQQLPAITLSPLTHHKVKS